MGAQRCGPRVTPNRPRRSSNDNNVHRNNPERKFPVSDTIDIKRFTAGKRVKYTSKTKTGSGVIEKVEEKATGHWVTIYDKANSRVITVRPSQTKFF